MIVGLLYTVNIYIYADDVRFFFEAHHTLIFINIMFVELVSFTGCFFLTLKDP